jgi:Family of unknown function (DUF5309)
MAVPTGTVQTFSQTRIREELANTINLLDAYQTPFYSRIGSDSVNNRTPEWLAHTAPPPDANNFRVEGDDATNISASQPIRYKNVCQLMDKPFQVTTTSLVVDSAGQKEKVRQTLLNGITLKTEIETFMTGNYASVIGAAAVAGRMAGAEAFIKTNVNLGATGAVGGFNTGTGLTAITTDGTQRAFTEVLLKDVIRQAFVSGGNNLDIILGPAQKQAFSAFTGKSTQYQQLAPGQKATITGGADVYVSDFGQHTAYPNRFSRNRTALIVDWSLWAKAWLQPIQEKELAINGHSERKMIYAEVTLKAYNEAGNGKVCDLT